jgi:hypothetical protein
MTPIIAHPEWGADTLLGNAEQLLDGSNVFVFRDPAMFAGQRKGRVVDLFEDFRTDHASGAALGLRISFAWHLKTSQNYSGVHAH